MPATAPASAVPFADQCDLIPEEDEDALTNNLNFDSASLVGVSLSGAQTYLASPTVTTAEKNAILEDNGRQDVLESIGDGQSDVAGSSWTLPSPWKAGPNKAWNIRGQEEEKYASIMQRLTRPRASTLEEARDDLGWKRYIPSLPKTPSIPLSSIVSSLRSAALMYPEQDSKREDRSGEVSNRDRPQRLHCRAASESKLIAAAIRPRAAQPSIKSSQTRSESGDTIMASPSSASMSRPSLARRITSEGDLRLHHTMSHASSLGDDERWQTVSKQVNSRMKAIKDSLADSSIKLPSFDLPPISSWLDLQSARMSTSDLLTSKNHESISTTRLRKMDCDRPRNATRRTYPSKTTNSNAVNAAKASSQKLPKFTEALEGLKGDIVILGGYRGSVLRSAKPPYRQLWVPLKVGLKLRKVDLEVGLQAEDEDEMANHIVPSGMLKHIGPVEISRRLFKRLAASKNVADGTLRVWDFGYDWRLSPQRLAGHLQRFLEALPCNAADVPTQDQGATVIAHSLGGLLTRHVINQRPSLVRGVVYAGTPQHCVNILGPLRNGDSVLLSKQVLTAQVNFTIRTSFALLPLEGKCFFNPLTKERYDVDFFNPTAWEDNRLSPVLARPLPPRLPLEPATGIVSSMAAALPSLTRPRRTNSYPTSGSNPASMMLDPTDSTGGLLSTRAAAPQMTSNKPTHQRLDTNPEINPSTAVTIPKHVGYEYLSRTLSEVKAFKESLACKPDHPYPPTAVIYGKSTPTVYGAQVMSREAIGHADAFDNLAFASGDGVVLARAAQTPEGYRVSTGGVVSSERGHVSLLADLEAVGKCLLAIGADRRRRERLASSATTS